MNRWNDNCVIYVDRCGGCLNDKKLENREKYRCCKKKKQL